MAARVLVVQHSPDVDGVEWAVAADGPGALERAETEPFDAVIVDTSLPVLDGWLVLATLGAHTPRPRLIAQVSDRGDIERARSLGADLCILAGTPLHARALEAPWQRHHANNSRRPTTIGVPV